MDENKCKIYLYIYIDYEVIEMIDFEKLIYFYYIFNKICEE